MNARPGVKGALRGLLATLLLAALFALMVAGPAAARDLVRMNGDVEVGPGEQYDSVVVMNGDIVIGGRVDGDVFAANGDIEVLDGGRVTGDAVSLTGRVTTVGSGVVQGDAVEGEISFGGGFVPDIPSHVGGVTANAGGFSGFGWLFMTLGTAGLGLLLVLISASTLHSVGREISDHLGRSALIGVVSLIGVPVVFLVLVVSVIGIPLALLMIPVVPAVGVYGMFAVSLLAGVRLLKLLNQPNAGDLWSMVAGVALVNLVLFVPVLGWLLFFVAGLVAFGAILARMWEYARIRRKTKSGGPQDPLTYPAPYASAPDAAWPPYDAPPATYGPVATPYQAQPEMYGATTQPYQAAPGAYIAGPAPFEPAPYSEPAPYPAPPEPSQPEGSAVPEPLEELAAPEPPDGSEAPEPAERRAPPEGPEDPERRVTPEDPEAGAGPRFHL